MTFGNVSRDIADLLTVEAVISAPVFAVEWGKGDVNGDIVEILQQTLVTDSPGTSSEDEQSYTRPVFEVWTRGDANETSDLVYARAMLVHEFLINALKKVSNTTQYVAFFPMTPIQAIGQDVQGQHRVYCKYFTYRNAR